MKHRELYRKLVPKNAYIITYSDLAICKTNKSAKRIAQSIYYPLGSEYSNERMDLGIRAHKIKEAEEGDWINELKLSYKMSNKYYLCGTIDRYYTLTKVIEDFKTTGKPASDYLKSKQVETYAFIAMNNDLLVNKGRYTTIDFEGRVLDQEMVEINEEIIANCYDTFILPRFNMIKEEIKKLRNQFK